MAASVKQINLLPAGCQPWNKDVCTASGDCFAYCATLAIYIYQLNPTTNKFQLRTIMSEHKKTITSIAFSTHDLDLLASAGTDLQVIIYSVSRQCVVAKLDNLRAAPFSIAWCPHERDSLSFISGKGPLHVWNYACPTPQAMNAHRDVQNFMSNVCQIRWHHSVMQKLVCGHNDGSISVFTPGCRAQRHVLRPENFEGTDEEDPVTAVEWDPLSNDYLLLSSTHNGVRLIDTSSLSVIMSFSLPSAAAQVHTLAWLHQAPGMFVTGDAHSGVLRLWNVSKSSPIENLRLKKTGFHALHVFSSSPQVDQQETALSGTKRGSLPPSLNASSRFALPPAHAVCTFLDGGVGLYDLGKRRWNFLRDQGHVETIFDCKFKPDDCDQLATGSFDGTIKIWDVNTLQAINSSPGNEGVIYCLSWAPADLNCIAASTSRNGVFIWDVSKGKIISRFNEHGKNPVYCVAWNHKDSRRIASAGGDGNCIVRQVDGKVLMKYKHPGAVFGCDWNPHNKDMLATGCDDKNVRVYYLATSNDQPLKVFSGHKSKVFHIRWSPLREGILCSGSDDCTIRLWDYTQECCCMVLQGHTGPVRGLLWNSEIPYLLVSGSWDYSIRVWDTRDGACIETVLDHGADVYGVTSHPQRPFSIASSSRDSTVRIWSLTPLVQPLEISILAERPWDQVLISPEHANALGTLPILVGKESRDLKLSIEKSPGDGRQQTLRCFSKFFLSSSGISNLWELVAIICGLEENLLSESYSRGIMHHSHICKYRASAAQELEMVKISKFGAGLGAPSREERLREAASIHLKLGNLQRYCELLLELGEWEKALCVAPGVSLEFWRKLTKQRAEVLLAEDSDDAVPFCVASGETERLVHHFSRHGQLQDAFLTATAAHEGSIIAPVNPVKGGRRSSQNGQQEDKSAEHLLMDTGRQLAEGYFSSGAPVQAACCHLAIDDVKGAICRLLRGSEYELAASVSIVLKSFPDLTNFAIEYLSRRCERLGQWELGIDVLKACVHQPAQLLSRLCARCAASMAEINHLHSKAGLPMMDACLEQAQDAEYRLGRMKEHETGDVLQCVQLFLLSTHPHLGLKHGIEHVRQQMSSADWRAEDSWGLIQMMSCMRTEKLQHQKCTQLRNELLLLSAYVGTLLAIRRKYCSIVLPLFRHTLELMKQEVWDLPSLSSSLVTSEMDAWLAHQAGLLCRKPPDNNAVYTELMHKVGTEPTSLEVGEDFVGSSHLPSHSDVHVSILTQHRIQGPAFFLEDGQSTLSISDAMMWAKVNAFSPLGSGVRINPF
ncbi:hypothetical protein CAPTEDRAFT_222827 [Capitella teleta]|uniref:Anaphase-promoting complex subunit 4 WD40 domain-containing protein n=1 Tax=Capitella teleta TaxID=283909 RepID=R7TRB9_CAPTE|nr:hypothetical protein CAPTEDRAFT_222827 [Capitella teleta]|eukprot:ELT94041.1 hypothetical protein CAPTEDRAFT_222827 [Capitella teleta]